MIKPFKQFIIEKNLCQDSSSILLAVSGGIDSMVMLDLFIKNRFKVAVCHCNFRLRGNDSEADAAFVENQCKNYDIPFFTKKFNTKSHALKNGISTQMAARNLRYNWFEKLLHKNSYDCIALGHNKDDVAETMLINLIRGTGIRGLHGILPKVNNLIRPLLFAERKEIEEYAKKNNIKYRTDSSNFEDYYLRNKIRLHTIPFLKTINPALTDSLYATSENLYHTERIYTQKVEEVRKEVFSLDGIKHLLNKKRLIKKPHYKSYMYELLSPFGFNNSQAASIIDFFNTHSGKVIYSPTHRILNDRSHIIIEPLKKTNVFEAVSVENKTKKLAVGGYVLKFETLIFSEEVKYKAGVNSTAYLDYDKLLFPLTIKSWSQSDKFMPLGMTKKKKLSDFFIDNKINLFEKEGVLVLCSAKDIAWIIGHRIDNRFKIGSTTKRVLKIEIL